MISRVTNAAIDEVQEWQNWPLDPVNPVVFFDALRVKIRDEGLVKDKAGGRTGSKASLVIASSCSLNSPPDPEQPGSAVFDLASYDQEVIVGKAESGRKLCELYLSATAVAIRVIE